MWLISGELCKGKLSEGLTIITSLSCCAIYALNISVVRDKLKQIALHRLLVQRH